MEKEIKTLERQALIFNIQKYNVYDGPGIRTIVFFKGCPLRCKWCANPEGLVRKPELMYKESQCIDCGACVKNCPLAHYFDSQGKHQVKRENLSKTVDGGVSVCPVNALKVTGEWKTISEIMKVVHEDDAFYEMSGGGVTLSGGECTSQPEACLSLLQACKADGINTAVETCGFANFDKLMQIAEYTDLFLYDMKHMDSDKHNQLTGVSNEKVLTNLSELLKRGYQVKIRMPMLKGINDSKWEIDAIIDFLTPYRDYENFHGIDLLPYHKLGVNKYAQLGMPYEIEGDPSLSQAELDQIERWISECQFPVTVVRH
jgi:pyruvate formate lyase activating enzyme